MEILKKYAGTATSEGSIMDEFSKQHQHQSIKNAPYLISNYHLIGANSYISWVMVW